jgi:DNA-binding NtrC family response regulator
MSCADGIVALSLIQTQATAISVVVTDVDMPRVGGVELAGALLRIRPGIRLVAMSGLFPEKAGGSAVTQIQQLAQVFLHKPFTQVELLGAVHRVLHPAEIPAPVAGDGSHPVGEAPAPAAGTQPAGEPAAVAR